MESVARSLCGWQEANEWVQAVNPEEEWKSGLGQVGRIRTILGAGIVDAGGLAVSLPFDRWLAIGIGIAGFITIVGLIGYRRYRRALAYTGVRFHELHHHIREDAFEIQEYMKAGDLPNYQQKYKRFHEVTANRIARFWRELLQQDGVNCAIRIAYKQQGGDCLYSTVGRSDGMDPNRHQNSVPVRADKGIASALRRKDQRGVCMISDIKSAQDKDWWEPCPNDDLPDIQMLLAAPINGYDENCGKSMLGILYVTSRKKLGLLRLHVEYVKALADLLGMIYPQITLSTEAADLSEGGPQERSSSHGTASVLD